MTKVIARVHPVHLMNVDWAPGGRQPSEQANRLGLWVRRKLAATIHIHHRHCYYYRPTGVEGWVDLGTAVKWAARARLYITAAVAINATVSGVIRTWVLSHWLFRQLSRELRNMAGNSLTVTDCLQMSWSACLPVCWADWWDVQKWPNRSRRRLAANSR